MTLKSSFLSFRPALFALIVFLFVSIAYFSPLLKGHTLSMHDINMASGAAQELKDHHEITGEWAWWTNSMFGGMPGFMIVGEYPNNFSAKLGSLLYGLLPVPANIFFLVMACFYLFMRVLRINNWIAIAGSIAYAFGTYNLVYIEAGHISKVLALAYIPGILAGFTLIFRRQFLIGTFLTALFLGLELYANHLQITYYFFFVLLTYSVFEFVQILKAKEYKIIPKIILSFLIALFIGMGMHTQRLWSNLVYANETIRGASELTQSNLGQSGLDKSYAFAWSYGIDESFNLLIPDLMGGSTMGALDSNSETYQLLIRNGVDVGNARLFVGSLPLYHGKQSSTAGPAYSGVLIIFLFIFGLFIIQNKWKWVHLGLLLFLLMISWGSNFPMVNYWIFDTLPGFNKFRAVSMILTVVHFVLVWGAAVSLNELLKKEFDFESIKKPLAYSLAIVIGLMGFAYLTVDFVGLRDEAFLSNLKSSLGDNLSNQMLYALRDDRSSMALSDIIRGVIYLILASGFIYFLTKKKMKPVLFSLLMILLISSDMISVGKRYFNNDDFQPKFRSNSATFEATPADLQILEDKDPNFRVLNLSTSFMSDARDSYFHKSLGGYHGAKLKKYQELVENQLIKEGRLNMGVVNMLNTKYFINNTANGVIAQFNQETLGNAWFIDSLIVVPNADEELFLTGTINTSNSAVTQSGFVENSKVYVSNGDGIINLTSYEPNRLVYSSSTTTTSFAIFSEIFYRGNQDWVSYLDGKQLDHVKVNYLLRGMEIPEGEHEIIFEFRPKSVEKGKIGDLIASISLLILFGVVVFKNVNIGTEKDKN